jgi:RNA polymerase sigma-70 factor (ECF subfamily)
MQREEQPDGSAARTAAQFATTDWSVVLAAGHAASTEAQPALEALCRAYWYPVYAYLRRDGQPPADAEDLTQEFFARLIAKDYLAHVDRAKGRFRSFLLAALRHFLSDQRDRDRAIKRGSGRKPLALEAHTAEERYRLEPVDRLDPERLYERRWAMTLLDHALRRLETEYLADGRSLLFAQLKAFAVEEMDARACGEVTRQLASTEGTVRTALHRLRQRYRELVREEIAQTVADPAEVDLEIQHLITLVSNG